ncbi:hypothetical protein L2E82_26360 [Cichorium intybus]|uniref:Uncharacterized protein n=1 Tax=Cichorium intybus TaxID=13427 RepID=A0ACB9CQJ2_CICIN|nr:hypothetical protein L2E82_26360 [Cichorium intybus]
MMAAFKGGRRAAETGLQIGSGFQKDGSGCLQIGTVNGRKRVIEEEGKRGEPVARAEAADGGRCAGRRRVIEEEEEKGTKCDVVDVDVDVEIDGFLV